MKEQAQQKIMQRQSFSLYGRVPRLEPWKLMSLVFMSTVAVIRSGVKSPKQEKGAGPANPVEDFEGKNRAAQGRLW
jgi:hypothetical protein